MSTPSITLPNLSRSTPDGRPIFSNLNIVFGPESTGLVGRNGIGKTTLLKLISGELSPSSGSVVARSGIHVLRRRSFLFSTNRPITSISIPSQSWRPA